VFSDGLKVLYHREDIFAKEFLATNYINKASLDLRPAFLYDSFMQYQLRASS
jgi:hypothetical protein